VVPYRELMSMTTRMSLAAVALAMLPIGAQATSICRWVDESGRTQMAQAVPEKYKKLATCTDSRTYEPTSEQRQAADRRAAEDQARAKQAPVALPA
jgi:hypothetical protein